VLAGGRLPDPSRACTGQPGRHLRCLYARACQSEVFVNSKRLIAVACACITFMMLWPADAAAQRRGYRRAPVRTAVFVSAGFYRPIYYDPFFYGGFYNPFYLGWYPIYAQYPRGYYGYGYGGYWASARIEIKPRDAQVYLDGYFVGMVDQFDGVFQRLDLPAGEHELTVYLKGYRPYRQKTLFRPGENYHFKAILEPLPAGAADEPPPQPAANRPDPYTQEQYRRDPRDPYNRDPYARDPSGNPNQPPAGDPGRTNPIPDRPGDRRPDNRSPDSGNFGTLNIRVQPADAVVIIDGEKWDSPEGGSRLVVQLAGGSHRVEVRKDGFKPYSATVQIRAGEAQTLNISLPPGLQP
jgi:hypothetical protein